MKPIFSPTPIRSSSRSPTACSPRTRTEPSRNCSPGSFGTTAISTRPSAEPSLPRSATWSPSEIDLTGFAFLDGFRHDSPIVSDLRIQSKVNSSGAPITTWSVTRFVNSSVTVDGRIDQFSGASAHGYQHESDPVPELGPVKRRYPLWKIQPERMELWGQCRLRLPPRPPDLLAGAGDEEYRLLRLQRRYLRLAFGTTEPSEIQLRVLRVQYRNVGTLKKEDRIF